MSLALPLLGVAGLFVEFTASNAVAKKAKPVVVENDETAIRPKELMERVQKLTSEELSSRAPGTAGDTQARALIAQGMAEAKLSPGGTAGDASPFAQPVTLTLVKTRLLPGGAPKFKSTAATVPVQLTAGLSEVVLVAGEAKPSLSLSEAEVVFVGYGLTSPEFRWDDYKDADVQGKVVIILDGDPQSDAKAFGGKARTAAARWTHKFALAAKKGAAAALVVVDEKDSAAAGVNLNHLRAVYGNNKEYVLDRDLEAPEAGFKVRGFITEEVTRRIMQSARIEFDELRRAAEQRDFRPVRPKLRMSVSFTNEIRTVESGNLVGVLPGSDPALAKEAVVYTAHFDGQGALDSAAGVATLLATAKAAVSRGPSPRTLVFAALCAQTEYLLGARHFLSHLPAPVQKVIGHINIDGIDPNAPQPTATQIGRGRSTLDALLDAAAKEQGRKVVADPNPELGLYYRSESLVFARAGIPSVFLGWPDLPRYLREDFRVGKDEIGGSWSFIGAAQDAELLLAVGRRIAEAKTAPAFKKTDEFAAK